MSQQARFFETGEAEPVCGGGCDWWGFASRGGKMSRMKAGSLI